MAAYGIPEMPGRSGEQERALRQKLCRRIVVKPPPFFTAGKGLYPTGSWGPVAGSLAPAAGRKLRAAGAKLPAAGPG